MSIINWKWDKNSADVFAVQYVEYSFMLVYYVYFSIKK